MAVLFGEQTVTGMGIRPASVSDATEVWSVIDAAFACYTDRMEGPPAPLLADYTKLCARGEVRVLRVGRRIVAVLHGDVVGDALQIETLAVHPDFAGRGCGNILLEWAVDLALMEGARAVTLYTNVVMHEARRFWTAMGFRETGRAWADGYDRIYFRRSLLEEGVPA